MADTETIGKSRARKWVIAFAALSVPLLAVFGIEGWRQLDENASVAEVESAYEASIEYFDAPDDWNHHFRTRHGQTCGYDEYHAMGTELGKTISHGGDLTTWSNAVLQDGDQTGPTDEEAETFMGETAGLPADAKSLLNFDRLDGTSNFPASGDAAGHIFGINVQRGLQIRVALLHRQGNRAQAMTELELLLEITTRLQHPFGMIELLLMTVAEPNTHLAAGRLAEEGPLSDRCNQLLKQIAETPESRLTVAEGEMAYFAWMYKKMGSKALALHSRERETGGTSGWFAWGAFGSAAEINRSIAKDNRALLAFCEDLRDGRKPTATAMLPAGLMRNFSVSYAELHLHRNRSVFITRIRQEMSEGDPAKLTDEIKAAGMILKQKPEGWQIAFKGDPDQMQSVEMAAAPDDFRRRFATLLLRN